MVDLRPILRGCCRDRSLVSALASIAAAAAAAGGRQLADTDVSTVGGARGSGSGAGNARMERAIGRLAPSADDGRRHPRRRRRFRQLPRQLVAAAERRGISREAFEHLTAGLTPDLSIMDLLDAQPEFNKSPWDYLDIAGERRTHRARARAVGAICLGFRRGRARLRRRPPHHRGDLGRGIELRHHGRRPPGAALDRDARLRRPPPRLFPRGVSLRAGNPAARRRQARPADRLLGRRVRPDAIHADHVQALRRRFRP